MICSANQPRKVDAVQLAPEAQRGLDQLVQAMDYAHDLQSSPWDFAVEIDHLLALGMTTSDLRWLVKRGYLCHAREITTQQDTDRRFEPPEQNLAFAKTTCFLLTEAGLAILGREYSPEDQMGDELPEAVADILAGPLDDAGMAADSPTDLPAGGLAIHRPELAAVPNWDGESRTFTVGQHLIKRFRVPSPNQEAVLEAFQEEGWPLSIDDPLQPVPEQEPKDRLRSTIKCLNLNQMTPLIRFRGDGTGQRVLWELRPDAVPQAESVDIPPLRRAA